MQTVTVDIINNKALKLLQDLELLQLIRLHSTERTSQTTIDWAAKYKGSMTRQPATAIDTQLKNLRNDWE
jgi:hypothetical protein